MTITHTFAEKTKALPEAIRRFLDPMPTRTSDAPAPPANGPPPGTLRLRLKPKSRQADYIDGAWWPRSSDLAAELPDLLAALMTRPGAVDRIVYDPDGWSHPPRHTTVAGRSIALEPYPFRLHNTMYVVGTDAAVMVLHVILPSTDSHTAYSELVAVGTQQEA